ncbi:helix-turn-helix transcriptional regulator [Natronorubrum bangense]|uniref:HTH iclR-type domain-containing protein n=2 Tax=Natronorubrum bangense TaxID=61858 RepID=L9WMV9_9EURY|nr:hypothetical protein [Natronorubrum bangense]ELY50732.1 hypothetical protein C494_05135 [Natronorubrum bangense JCM 10635]QCC54376.1 hypothetical protein DV706_07670 [Natronorubrum bangense]
MDVKGLWALVWVLVGIGCALALLPALSAGAAGTAGAQGALMQESSDESDRLAEADDIHIDIFVSENGSATFAIDYRFENNSDGTWEALQEDVEANPEAYADSQEARWNEVLAEGVNATERDEMEISNVSVGTDTSAAPRDIGRVEVRFEWSKFAYVELNRIEAGDALAGYTLSQNTSLQIIAPEGYMIEETAPSPEDVGEDYVYWDSDGSEFSPDPPLVVMIEETNDDGQPTDATDGPSMPWLAVLAALALLATVGAAGWLLKRNRDDAATTNSGGMTPPVADGSSAADGSNGPSPDLLSNEERVLQLLEAHGGRIKQQAVVSELDWTEAKTSQVVGSLREDDEIEVFRIGRENVLALPDEDEAET